MSGTIISKNTKRTHLQSIIQQQITSHLYTPFQISHPRLHPVNRCFLKGVLSKSRRRASSTTASLSDHWPSFQSQLLPADIPCNDQALHQPLLFIVLQVINGKFNDASLCWCDGGVNFPFSEMVISRHLRIQQRMAGYTPIPDLYRCRRNKITFISFLSGTFNRKEYSDCRQDASFSDRSVDGGTSENQ